MNDKQVTINLTERGGANLTFQPLGRLRQQNGKFKSNRVNRIRPLSQNRFLLRVCAFWKYLTCILLTLGMWGNGVYCGTMHVNVRGQLCRLGSFLPECGSWALNSGPQAWWQPLCPLSHLSRPAPTPYFFLF